MANLPKKSVLARATAALLMAAGSAAAAAATPDLMIETLSKSAAILGGPSHLAQIMAEQGALPVAAAVYQQQPISYPPPQLSFETPQISDAVREGRPDIFGTVALKVDHTPLDSKWRSVANSPVTGAPAVYARSLRGLDPMEIAQRVNSYVNRRVRYTDDIAQYGHDGFWASADQTLRRGRGDCKDYAIAKLELLRSAGFPERDLYFTIVRDLVRRADHAVIVARAGEHLLVLDDGADKVLESKDVSDYRPIITFASYGEWIHGYRVQPSLVTVAQNPQAAFEPATDAQRSLNASLLAFNTGFNR